jgi:hypothetical protein
MWLGGRAEHAEGFPEQRAVPAQPVDHRARSLCLGPDVVGVPSQRIKIMAGKSPVRLLFLGKFQ